MYEHTAYSPTITECLLFWTASAMRIATTLRYPKVCEEPSRSQTPCTVYDAMAQSPDAALALVLLVSFPVDHEELDVVAFEGRDQGCHLRP